MLATNNETLDLWSRERSSDFPLFDFNQIANATGNFLLDNKLGEGGLGPVYKVLPICFHPDTAFLFLFLVYLKNYAVKARKATILTWQLKYRKPLKEPTN